MPRGGAREGAGRPPNYKEPCRKQAYYMPERVIAKLFKLAVEDLKAYYFEAATAQPGQEETDSNTLSAWFYQETVAGNVLSAVRNAHKDTEDKAMRLVINILLIPKALRSNSRSEANR